MKPKSKLQRPVQAEGSSWMLVMGGALLSTLSIRLGWKLKQMFDAKRINKSENVKMAARRRVDGYHFPSNSYYYSLSEENGYPYHSGSVSEGRVDPKDGDPELPLVAVNDGGGTGAAWTAPSCSPERLELPRRESPCVSESGSTDMFSKREVVQKLRQQLKRRDEMILDMQAQITDLQRALTAQAAQSAHHQAQLDCAARDLLESEREVQQLRKAIAGDSWHGNGGGNGRVNGYSDGSCGGGGGAPVAEKRIEMLKREVDELKEVIEGKEFLLQSYKEQKTELSSKVNDLQLRLSSHVPSIL